MNDTTPVTIVGGGIGGLTLAAVLHRNGIPAVVHERDPSPSGRAQGGTLDLHPESGQRAMAEAGLTDALRAVARPEGQDLVILDHTGSERLRMDTPDGPPGDVPFDRPEVDRGVLRDLLLDTLPAGTVRWGSAVSGTTTVPGGGHRLHLADGTHADCELIVGADGGRSRIRPLLTAAEPTHSGTTMVEMWIPDADATRPAVGRLVGRGSFWAVGPDRTLSAQRSGDGSIRVHVSLRTAADWADTCGIPFADPDVARAAVADLLPGWSPSLRAIVAATTGPVLVRPLAVLPTGLTWPHRRGVTLLGDAAHLMPPVGEGANQAMLDGALLALALAAHPGDPDAAVRAYEEEMFARTAPIAVESAALGDRIVSSRGVEDLLEFFAGVA